MSIRISRIAAAALLATLLAAGSASAQVSFGIRIGPPPAPRVVRVVPVRPGPRHVWVNGYWEPYRNRYRWHDGYWAVAPYRGAYWVGPRYRNGMYFKGYWGGHRNR